MQNDIAQSVPNAYARYLGLSLRSDGFGFVVVEDTVALDCGVRACEQTGSIECLAQLFDRILRTYLPTEVIMLGIGSVEATEKRGKVQTAIAGRVSRKNIPVVRLSAASLTKHFRQVNAETKYEIALAVARILPELAWRLPPKRRAWESEPRRSLIFEAAAAVIAHAKL